MQVGVFPEDKAMSQKPGTKKTAPRDIDLGLAVSGALLKPGQTRTLPEIAAFTGTSKQQVQQLEARAMANLRRAFLNLGFNRNELF